MSLCALLAHGVTLTSGPALKIPSTAALSGQTIAQISALPPVLLLWAPSLILLLASVCHFAPTRQTFTSLTFPHALACSAAPTVSTSTELSATTKPECVRTSAVHGAMAVLLPMLTLKQQIGTACCSALKTHIGPSLTAPLELVCPSVPQRPVFSERPSTSPASRLVRTAPSPILLHDFACLLVRGSSSWAVPTNASACVLPIRSSPCTETPTMAAVWQLAQTAFLGTRRQACVSPLAQPITFWPSI